MSELNAPAAVLQPGITLYLIRHGETPWNLEARYQGQRDIPLNDTGREQAKLVGRKLWTHMAQIADADFVSSPLGRATETMRLLRSELELDPESFRVDGSIRELHYGHWEGQLASELTDVDPDGVAAKAADPLHWRPRGGESYADLMVRVARWISTLQRTTVAVSHGGVSRVARGALLEIESSDVPFLEVPQDRALILRDRTMSWL